jgi:hypothetical protein
MEARPVRIFALATLMVSLAAGDCFFFLFLDDALCPPRRFELILEIRLE